MRIITDEEKSKIRENYPGLSVVGDVVVRGLLRFTRIHLGDRKLCPPCSEQDTQSDSFIDDSYFIKEAFICHDGTPCVWDAGRIASRAKKMGRNAIDMHVYPGKDNMLCLGYRNVVVARCNGSIINLIEKLLIPYLYYHSYWEKKGKEPWPGLSHGWPAGLEAIYYHCDELTIHQCVDIVRSCVPQIWQNCFSGAYFQSDNPCFCGSGKVASDCHPIATKGINSLRKKMQRVI